MSLLSKEKLLNITSQLNQMIDGSEKIFLPHLSQKLAQAYEAYPHDQTIFSIHSLVNKFLTSNKHFITRAELQDIYNRFYCLNNKFSSLFAEELKLKKTALLKPKYAKPQNIEPIDLSGQCDLVLKNELSKLMGGPSNITYKQSHAKLATDICERQILSTGVKVAKVCVVDGNGDMIVCGASFDTPKGSTNVLVPVDIKNNQVYLPTFFIGNGGTYPIEKSALTNYILSNIGVKLAYQASDIINAKKIISNNTEADSINKISLAVAQFKLENKSNNFSQDNLLFGKECEKIENKDLQVPRIIDPQFEKMADQLVHPSGIAEFKFGRENVKNAREMVAKHLMSMGFNSSKISIANVDNNTIICSVSLDGDLVGFNVPIKVSNNKLIHPQIIISNKKIYAFSQENIKSLYKTATDHAITATTSSYYGLNNSSLLNIVKQAVMEQNYKKAEDALNVLLQNGDKKAYDNAFKYYIKNIGEKKPVQEKCACTKPIKVSHSLQVHCGHLNLPLEKVAQDRFGHCVPLYRKNMEETSDGAYLMSSKLVLT